MSEILDDRPRTAARLLALGIRPTRQRLDIACVLFECFQRLSAEQVFERVNGEGRETSKATVYNTLRLFSDKGLIREVVADPTRVFYDSNIESHHHFYDAVRGELTDIPADSVRIAGLPSPPAGTQAEAVEVIIRIRPSA